MQLEQVYYVYYFGCFVYVKDEVMGELFLVFYELVWVLFDVFQFWVGCYDFGWIVEYFGLCVEMILSLLIDDVVELWELCVIDLLGCVCQISVVLYFFIGYMLWMNQLVEWCEDFGGIVVSLVMFYQKVVDYFKNLQLKDKMVFFCEC